MICALNTHSIHLFYSHLPSSCCESTSIPINRSSRDIVAHSVPIATLHYSIISGRILNIISHVDHKSSGLGTGASVGMPGTLDGDLLAVPPCKSYESNDIERVLGELDTLRKCKRREIPAPCSDLVKGRCHKVSLIEETFKGGRVSQCAIVECAYKTIGTKARRYVDEVEIAALHEESSVEILNKHRGALLQPIVLCGLRLKQRWLLFVRATPAVPFAKVELQIFLFHVSWEKFGDGIVVVRCGISAKGGRELMGRDSSGGAHIACDGEDTRFQEDLHAGYVVC